MDLVVGATGRLGGEICRLLLEQGAEVRALVRDTSSPDKVERLISLGAEVLRGDLGNRASLAAACRGASAVVSTASSVGSRKDGDSIETVDRLGQLALVDAAEEAGVGHFVLISFPTVDVDFPLQSAKRAVEERLRRGRMTFTILQPTFFTEVWLSPALGFDPARAVARIYGDGHNRISWISFEDVAKFAAAALRSPRAVGQAIKLGGPDALSPLEAMELAQRVTGREIVAQHVPEAALRAQLAAAADPLQQSLAGLMLYYARGDAIDMTEALRALPVQRLKSVLDYFRATA
ncbi:MAG: SDR family oxidoreductase [Betaproteobacteria bacterium]|nr:SDR family oxidoreductase [Betaproteobacteria bacterium]